MKKSIIFAAITLLITAGMLSANETGHPAPISPAKIRDISGKIQAVMTDIPAGQPSMSGAAVVFTKIKVKDEVTGQEHAIQLAPSQYLRLKGVLLQKDDPIRVKAFNPESTPDMKSLEIEIKGQVIILRDQYGNGLWEKPDIREERKEYQKR